MRTSNVVLTIAQKMVLLVGLMTIATASTGVYMLEQVHDEMIAGEIKSQRTVVEAARSTAQALLHQVEAQTITREQAISRLKDAVATMRHGDNNYIALYDFNGIAVYHPEPTIMGTSRLDALVNGIAVVRLQRDDIRDHGTSVQRYFFKAPGADAPLLPKIAFAMDAGAFGLFISTSNQINAIEAAFRPRAIRVAAIIAAVVLASAVVAWMIARSITRPLSQLCRAMDQIASGDFTHPIEAAGRADEIGKMGAAVQVFRDNGLENERLRTAQAALAEAAEQAKAEHTNNVAKELDMQVGQVAASVADGARAASEAAHAVDTAFTQVEREVITVTGAATQATQNVQTVAAAAEQLVASIAEVNAQVFRSSTLARDASTKTTHTDENMQRLAQTAAKIGEIVGLIDSIASQTNLLALNATIEAARAGETGKGFAVVASEVKQLATQTANATEGIRSQIHGMQQITGTTVTAMTETLQAIREIDNTATAIAAAVEQQHAATQEIVRSMQQAAAGTSAVADGIARIGAASSGTTTARSRTIKAAESLFEQSSRLRQSVNTFLSSLQGNATDDHVASRTVTAT
jgi:methyl-accepting chemotaxis protein